MIEDSNPSANDCTLQTSSRPASKHEVQEKAAPLPRPFNVGGMSVHSKHMVKRKTRVRLGGDAFHMNLLANRELK